MALRAVKTEEEIRSIPTDQPILIELPGGVIEDEPDDKKGIKTERLEPSDPDAKKLQEQLEAALAAQQTEKARADKSEREAAERIAEANRAAEEARKRTSALEGDVINGGLAAAQSERDSAKAALQTAGEAGDWKAIAEAQSRIGRAEAKILSFESGAAEIAERTEAEKHKPEPKPAVRQAPSFSDAVRSNPDLMQTEKDWMLKNETAFKDADFNKKLDFAYRGAMSAGLVRGSQAYFDHIEKATGLVADNQDDRSTSVQAPPSRNERGSDGRPSSNRITLTPEERDMAKSMGVSEIDYAKQKVRFEEARRLDPEKYSSRG